MNKIVNPLVRFILRSPFHKLMSNSVLLITCCGRKSGKSYTLPVNYVQIGKTIFIVPGMPEKKTWWRNLLGGAEVGLLLNGNYVSGAAGVLQGDVMAASEAMIHYFKRFPPSAKLHGVRMEPDGVWNAEELQKAAQSCVVVKVELEQ